MSFDLIDDADDKKYERYQVYNITFDTNEQLQVNVPVKSADAFIRDADALRKTNKETITKLVNTYNGTIE